MSFSFSYKYLRLSVTKQCDLTCAYCRDDCPDRATRSLELTPEEILAAVKFLQPFGIRHVRLTGGEPLLRRDLPRIVEMLAPQVETLGLTTNGTQLSLLAQDLRLAGLAHINIHLDTLNSAIFKNITGGNIKKVLKGIEAAQSAGLFVKLNTVLLRDINDAEVISLANFAAKIGAPLRFIELMPFGRADFFAKHFWPMSAVFEKLKLSPLDEKLGLGPARYYKDEITGAVVGLISSVTRPFCSVCDRLRLTADGRIRRCLAKEEGLNIRKRPFDTEQICCYLQTKEYDHQNFRKTTANSLCAIGG